MMAAAAVAITMMITIVSPHDDDEDDGDIDDSNNGKDTDCDKDKDNARQRRRVNRCECDSERTPVLSPSRPWQARTPSLPPSLPLPLSLSLLYLSLPPSVTHTHTRTHTQPDGAPEWQRRALALPAWDPSESEAARLVGSAEAAEAGRRASAEALAGRGVKTDGMPWSDQARNPAFSGFLFLYRWMCMNVFLYRCM